MLMQKLRQVKTLTLNQSPEASLIASGFSCIAGVDEVGRGCLAGPVFAAACILSPDFDLPGLNDSKKLSPAKREQLFPLIQAQSLSYAIASVDVAEIDRINIFQASHKAMCLAVEQLTIQPQHLIIDGTFKIPHALPQLALPKADALSPSVAAASILAKVSRDRLMAELDQVYPGFGLAQHKGYGTAQHLTALRQLGETPIHRKSFHWQK